MRVFVLLGLLALCASAFAVRDDAALQPSLPSNEDDDSFLESLSANMNVNEDLDNEINSLDDVKSADELKEKATEIADKLAEMKADLEEEEARTNKKKKRGGPDNNTPAPTPGPSQAPTPAPGQGQAPVQPPADTTAQAPAQAPVPAPEQQQKHKKHAAAMKAILTNPACGWEKVGNHFVKVMSADTTKNKHAKSRVTIVSADGHWLHSIGAASVEQAKAAGKEKATAWVNARPDATRAEGWQYRNHTFVKNSKDGAFTYVRYAYGCYEAHRVPSNDQNKVNSLIDKINTGFAAWNAKKDVEKCNSCGLATVEQQQQQQPEQQGGATPQAPANGQQQPQQPAQAPAQAPGQAQAPAPQGQAPGQTPTGPGPAQKDEVMNDDEDSPAQQQPTQQQPTQQSKPQQAPQQPQQPTQQSKPQQQQDKVNQNQKKEQQKKDKKEQQKKDKKEQQKKDKKEQQDQAAVQARVEKLKNKHGFKEIKIKQNTYLYGVVEYTSHHGGKEQQKKKTVLTNDKGNYVREYPEKEEEVQHNAKWLKKHIKKALPFPPKNYDVADKFLVRTTDEKTYIRGNFFPFSLLHCKKTDNVDECISKKKALLEKRAADLEKETEDEHKDVDTPAEDSANTDNVEAEAAPAPQQADDADDV